MCSYGFIEETNIPSNDYHDYVIKNGILVGDFDNMYKNSNEVPWHQDQTAYYTSDSQFLSLIRSYGNSERIAEIGCGLGYFANRLQETGSVITGFDISPYAIEKARERFPNVTFEVLDIAKPLPDTYNGVFDMVLIKEVFWYVFPKMDIVMGNIRKLVKSNGMVFVAQSFPEKQNYVGKDVISSPDHLVSLFDEYGFAIDYYSVNHNRIQNFDSILHVACERGDSD